MEYITLYNNVKMPLVGLGTWDLRGQECIDSVSQAIQLGYRLIDTAQMYGNEKEVGIGIQQSGIAREELFITTKIYGNSNSYLKTKKAIQQSLKNLQVEYMDLLLLHEPYTQEQEMYKALVEAYQEGLVRAIGISNYHGRRFESFMKNCSMVPMINQVECHVFFQKEKFQQELNKKNIAMQAWSPLAQAQKNIAGNPILQKIANKYHKTPHQIALKFLVQRNISVVPKSKHIHRLKENLQLFDFHLTPQEMEEIKSIDEDRTLFAWTEMF